MDNKAHKKSLQPLSCALNRRHKKIGASLKSNENENEKKQKKVNSRKKIC